MNPSTQSRWHWYARFLIAWFFVLIGAFAVIPAIGFVLEVVLRFRSIGWFEMALTAYGLLVLGLPTIAIWSIAYCVRSGRISVYSAFWVWFVGVGWVTITIVSDGGADPQRLGIVVLFLYVAMGFGIQAAYNWDSQRRKRQEFQ